MIRIGIVGLGYTVGVSDQHTIAWKLIPGIRIVTVYDVRTGRGEEFVKQHQLDGTAVYQSYEKLLDQMGTVCIRVPSVTHVDLAMTALKAGKHVPCGKPFTLREEDRQEALSCMQLSGRVYMIGPCYRYVPAFRYMEQLIQDGALGEVFWGRQVMCSNRMANPGVLCEWKVQKAFSGTGVIGDLGSHMLDMTEWPLREQCGGLAKFQCMDNTRITEQEEIGTGRRRAVTDSDVASFTGQMENGVLTSYTIARLDGSGYTFELYGSDGSLVYDRSRPSEAGIRKKPFEGGYQEALTFIPMPEGYYTTAENTPMEPLTTNFFHQAEDFLNCILNGKHPETNPGRDAYIQRLIDTIKRTAEGGVVEDVRD